MPLRTTFLQPLKRFSFSMSLRGAQRRGNPFSLQYSIAESSTLGEYEKMLRIRPSSTSLHTQAPGKSLHVIARSAATWQSASPAAAQAKRNYSRRIRRSCGFALGIANLLGFPAGLRIATPVCALARNDMLKTDALLRMQGGGARVLPRKVLANADTRQVSACRCELRSCNRRNGFPSACHCEERSDVAIRSPCSTASQKAVL